MFIGGLQVSKSSTPKGPRMDSHGPMSSNWVPSTSSIFAEPENRTLKVSAKMRNSRLQETSGNIVSPSFQGQSPQHALLWTVGPHFSMLGDAWRLRGKQSPPHGSLKTEMTTERKRAPSTFWEMPMSILVYRVVGFHLSSCRISAILGVQTRTFLKDP